MGGRVDVWSLKGGLGRGSFVVLYVGLVVTPLLLAQIAAAPGENSRGEISSALGFAAVLLFALT